MRPRETKATAILWWWTDLLIVIVPLITKGLSGSMSSMMSTGGASPLNNALLAHSTISGVHLL
jgi:hypothetical protein